MSAVSRWPGGHPWDRKSGKVLRPVGLEQSEWGEKQMWLERCGVGGGILRRALQAILNTLVLPWSEIANWMGFAKQMS